MESLSRVFLLMLGVALILALARGGWPGVTDWLRAKFLGKEPAAAAGGKGKP